MGKNKKYIEERTKQERQDQVRPILEQLSKLNLTMDLPPIKTLMENLQKYIQNGEYIKLCIPFPSHSSNIKGELVVDKKSESCVVIRPSE